MSQSGGAWQTASSNRPRNSQSSSRGTPQNRSTTASPSQQGQPTQPPKNPWTQNRSSTPNGPPPSAPLQQQQQEPQHEPLNAFNSAEVKAFLSHAAGQGSQQTYKVGDGAGGRSGGAWGAKSNTMANGQPFFVQLAKQVATSEGGG